MNACFGGVSGCIIGLVDVLDNCFSGSDSAEPTGCADRKVGSVESVFGVRILGMIDQYKKKEWKDGDRKPYSADQQQFSKLFDKLPPQAHEAECAVLGAMILDWQVIGDVVQILSGARDFYQHKHEIIYQTLIDLYDETQSIDLVQVKQKLEDKKVLEDIGGIDYLIELGESVPATVTAPHYARLVRDKAVTRRLIDASSKILYDAYHSTGKIGELLNTAEQEIFKLAESQMGADDTAHLNDLLQETYKQLEEMDGKTITGIETGYFELDDMLNGLNKGDMVILAARPSMGKTALALNICEHVSATNGVPSMVFSLEMGKQQLAQRLLCSRSGVDSQRLRKNTLTGDDFAQLSMTVGDLTEAPLYIDDTPGLTLLQLRAKARRMVAKHGIKMIMIDYLQLMTNPGANNRQEEVSEMSRGIKAMARELKVPVICLSQLNRGSENREGHKPRMSDLRESGSIEQDADVVMMLHREDYYNRGNEDYEDTGLSELIICKQRNGPCGTVKLGFDGATTSFKNLSNADIPGGVY